MIQPVALTGAALRVMRTAAGRRVLQVVLLVGGLFALGFLCGEQAQAADGAAPAPVAEVSSASAGDVRSLTSGGVAGLTHSPAEATPAKRIAPRRPAAEADADAEAKLPPLSGVGPDSPVQRDVAGGPALRDVADVPSLRDVAKGSARPDGPSLLDVPDVPDLSKAPPLSPLPPLASLPALPSLPALSSLPSQPAVPSGPSLPSAPTMPGLPQLPGAPSLPVQTLPISVTPAPQPGSPTSPTASTTTAGQAPVGRSDAATPLAYGPRFTPGSDGTGVLTRTPVHRAAGPTPAPVYQEPTHDPGGALSGKAAGDTGTGTPRHGGDAHAVTFDHRAPLRLVPGASADADADGTRDRHRDIPVSPA
ncbi:hypothetical protein OG604_28320 [Streptomyces sp. NBC_01231]|nr:hypothetical protein OG604_28320 [Streptomyces sp. NBC_01231]